MRCCHGSYKCLTLQNKCSDLFSTTKCVWCLVKSFKTLCENNHYGITQTSLNLRSRLISLVFFT